MGYDRLIMPRLVVSLDAGDEFLRERVIWLPEPVVVGTHNTDEAFSRRLADYRAVNTDDDSVTNYFDELEFHPHRFGPYSVHTSLSTHARTHARTHTHTQRTDMSEMSLARGAGT